MYVFEMKQVVISFSPSFGCLICTNPLPYFLYSNIPWGCAFLLRSNHEKEIGYLMFLYMRQIMAGTLPKQKFQFVDLFLVHLRRYSFRDGVVPPPLNVSFLLKCYQEAAHQIQRTISNAGSFSYELNQSNNILMFSAKQS